MRVTMARVAITDFGAKERLLAVQAAVANRMFELLKLLYGAPFYSVYLLCSATFKPTLMFFTQEEHTLHS